MLTYSVTGSVENCFSCLSSTEEILLSRMEIAVSEKQSCAICYKMKVFVSLIFSVLYLVFFTFCNQLYKKIVMGTIC